MVHSRGLYPAWGGWRYSSQSGAYMDMAILPLGEPPYHPPSAEESPGSAGTGEITFRRYDVFPPVSVKYVSCHS